MQSLLANSNLSSMKDAVRENALLDFHFFSNHVLGLALTREDAQVAQEAVNEMEDFILPTLTPRALASALQSWLSAHGITVVCSKTLPKSEVLSWLDLTGAETLSELSVTLEIFEKHVRVSWL